MRPDSVVVLSLLHRVDRRTLQGDLSQRLGMPVQVHDALGPAEVEGLSPDGWGASQEAYACLRSHRRALLGALFGAGDSILVFEDDALVPQDFWERFDAFEPQVPDDWEGLWLGGEHLRRPTPVPDTGGAVVRCAFTTRTHAYLVRGESLGYVVDVMDRTLTHWDIGMGARMRARPHVYAPDPFLVSVIPSPGDIPDSSPFPAPRED